ESDVWLRLGEFCATNGECRRAEDAFQRVLQVLEGAENAHSDRIAAALNDLAKVYINQGEYSKARPLCRRALAVLESVYDPHHPSLADVHETLARLRP
ncbi:MAG: tetratricopeptide repeat protein, partial [Sedimentisphaerales bacterium]